MNFTTGKMTIEVWSDVMCPFCYIGKRKFETALAQFPQKNSIQLVWKSFQLSPNKKTEPTKNINQFLAEHKGISLDEAKRMNDYVTQKASEVGLTFNFDKAVVANSFNAHRFSHFAKKYGKQNDAEEKLFYAYFTDGKNTDDNQTLIQLGTEIGLDAGALKMALENGTYAEDVKADIYEAQKLGIRSVPFFVFNRKYSVSGAQDSDLFLRALEQSFTAWREENPETKVGVLQI